MTMAGIRPPFKSGSDTDCFLWARAWADDPNFIKLATPRLGCIVVLSRSGGGHVTTYEADAGSSIKCRGGNQSDAVNLATYPKSNVVAYVWPKDGGTPPEPIDPEPERLPVLRKGDTGPSVAYMQSLIPKWIDGDFGSTTETLLKEFQRSKGLEVDGICGEQTWEALGAVASEPGPPPDVLLHVSGKCSWFGGPDDTGVKPDEGLAFISNVNQAPELFLPEQPPGTTGLARRLDPEVFYIACRWDYKKTPRAMLLSEMALVRVGDIELEAQPADWGPNVNTGRVADISPGLMEALGIETDDEVEVLFPSVKP